MHHAPCGGAAAGAPSDLPVVFLVRHDGEEASSEVAALLAARLQQERPTRLSDELLPQEVIGLAPVSSEPPSLLIMIVTCEADGSVSRSVRKLVRELKSRARQQRCQTPEAMEMATREGGELKGLRCALIALGRAKCSSSAMSTKDTVYGTARQLFKLLPHAGGASVQEPPSADFFELDVELDDIEAKVESWGNYITDIPEHTTGNLEPLSKLEPQPQP